jgi:hypothetical protein
MSVWPNAGSVVYTYVRRRYLDTACILLEDLVVGDVRLEEEGLRIVSSYPTITTASSTHLNIMLCELLSQRSTAGGEWVDRVVDCDLAILMVQPRVDILPALLQNLLTKYNGGSGSVDEEVVFRYINVWAHGGATIVTEVKDPSLDTKPGKVSNAQHTRSVGFTIEGNGRVRRRCGCQIRLARMEMEHSNQLTSCHEPAAQLEQWRFFPSGRACLTWCCRAVPAP